MISVKRPFWLLEKEETLREGTRMMAERLS